MIDLRSEYARCVPYGLLYCIHVKSYFAFVRFASPFGRLTTAHKHCSSVVIGDVCNSHPHFRYVSMTLPSLHIAMKLD